MTQGDDVRDLLRRFISGTSGEWDWDDFISTPIKDDPYLDGIRLVCRELPSRFPPEPDSNFYCSDEGWERLKTLEKDFLP